MEILGFIALVLLTLSFCFRELTNFVKQLKSSGTNKLLTPGKMLNFTLSVSSEDKKNEVCATNTNSKKDSLD